MNKETSKIMAQILADTDIHNLESMFYKLVGYAKIEAPEFYSNVSEFLSPADEADLSSVLGLED